MNLSYKIFYALLFVIVGYVIGIKYPESTDKTHVDTPSETQVWRCTFPEQSSEALFANEKNLYIKTNTNLGSTIQVRFGDKIAHDCSRRYPEK
ncbi:hypothetical protein J4Z08_23035 [Citrobacter portucalensis]|uniref:hypothetical protein n=1 Tax=Citrobacter portucalensis TaxID=1639133 RepID=UPI0031405C8B